MKRTLSILTIAVTCLISAFALAQSQQAPAPDTASARDAAPAPETTPAPAPAAATEAAAPPAQPSPATDANVTAPVAARPATPYSDLRRAQAITGDASAGQAKSELCAACHGPQGVAIAPNFPNLAGQRIDFLYWQLVEFKRGTLTESPMTPLVADLSDQDMRNLSAYYAGLEPAAPVADPVAAAPADTPAAAPAADAAPVDAAQAQRGERLYLSGDPAKGIPPCQGCHGTDARGHAHATRPDRNGHVPYAAYPALRGQQSVYLQTKLGEYRDGKLHDSTADFVMRGVGERLDDDSIQALSAWLSALPY